MDRPPVSLTQQPDDEEDEGMYLSGFCAAPHNDPNRYGLCRRNYARATCECSCHSATDDTVIVSEPVEIPEPVAVVEVVAAPVFKSGGSVMVTYANGMSRILHNVTELTSDTVNYGTKGRSLSYSDADTVEILV
jgi:hypothetical protein